MQTVKNISELIEAFGGVRAFGQEIYPDSDHPSKRGDLLRKRGCIPPERWAATIRRSKARGITITRDQLAAWYEKQAGRQYHRGPY